MSEASKLSLEILRRVGEFLEGLPEEHVADIANGRAKISYIPWGEVEAVIPKPRQAAPKRVAAPKHDYSAVLSQLDAARSRDEGRILLTPLGVTELRALATSAGMSGVSKTPKADLIEKLVGLRVGGRLSFAGMQQL